MSELLTRSLTALASATILIACVLAGKILFLLFFLVLTVVSLNEYYYLFDLKANLLVKTCGLASGIFTYVSVALLNLGYVPLKFFSLSVIPIYFIFLAGLRNEKRPSFHDISYALAGLIYVVVPVCMFVCTAFLLSNRYNYQPALGYLFAIWANDTGAYFTGKFLGKNRLLERISPKKTWEGVGGGALATFFTVHFISKTYLSLSESQWMSIGALVTVFGTLGDLVESLLKREVHTKDSGRLLPGHGGVLDRFDGLFLSAPFVFLYLLLITK